MKKYKNTGSGCAVIKGLFLMLITILAIGVLSDPTITIVKAKTIEPKNSKINVKQTEVEKLNQWIIEINRELQKNIRQVNELEKQLNNTQTQITGLESEINEIKERIEKGNDILRERVQYYQKNGENNTYLQVVFGSNDFSDFIERVDSVSTIVQADQELLRKQYHEKQELEKKLTLIQIKREESSKIKEQIEQTQSDLRETEKHYENSLSLSDPNTIAHRSDVVGEESEVPVSNTIGSSNIVKIIKAGYQYIGNSVYVFGGGRTEKDIISGRFDCSSFVHWAFSQAGIEIGTTTDAIKHNGRQVSLNELQPGDLVFFDTYKKDGHVGIYLGNEKFLGSQSSTGVAIADMSTGYWKERFNGRVVRIIE
ncbi:NlpC/P60 family protein [Niallia sp. Krafla_26]|uniref:C40 family peptidase n=1 Tax=Niallia sp. Krafla_26 TaxID=3064703 RepID=UPI003D162DD5